MSTALQLLVGVCAVLLTIAGMVFAFGRTEGATAVEVAAMKEEIRILREWRHKVGNFEASIQALDYLTKRLERLEERKG